MSPKQRSKKAKFANRMRWTRKAAAIRKANSHKPGFMGVVSRFSLRDGKGNTANLGAGAVFVGLRF